jgi:hypothetical protein
MPSLFSFSSTSPTTLKILLNITIFMTMKLIIKRMKEDRSSRVSRVSERERESEEERSEEEVEKSCSGNSHSLIAKT